MRYRQWKNVKNALCDFGLLVAIGGLGLMLGKMAYKTETQQKRDIFILNNREAIVREFQDESTDAPMSDDDVWEHALSSKNVSIKQQAQDIKERENIENGLSIATCAALGTMTVDVAGIIATQHHIFKMEEEPEL